MSDGLSPARKKRCGSTDAKTAALAVFISVASHTTGVAQAQSPGSPSAEPSVEAARVGLETRKAELANAEGRVVGTQGDLTNLEADAAEINRKLIETGGLVQATEAKMTSIEARLTELEAQEALLRGSLAQRHGQISKLLGALQRMGRNPPPVMITGREDALEMVRSAMLLAMAFPELRGQALELADKLNGLVRVMTDIRTEGDKLKAETARLDTTRARLASLMDTKKHTITERQAELKEMRKAVAAISKDVTDLNDLIAKLGNEVSKQAGVKAAEQEAERQLAAAPPETKQPEKPTPITPDQKAAEKGPDVAALPPADPPPKAPVVELAPVASSLVPGSPGRIRPAVAFQLAKGKLPLPAQGRRVLSFGDKTQYGATSKGLVLETRFGAQVVAPCDGWIVFAGEFRSYGQLLIINATGGYHVLLAGMSAIDVEPGQFVLAAEPVGTMSGAPRTAQQQAGRASPAAATGAASSPVLYVEFRKDSQPIDPDPWWVGAKGKN